MLAQHRDHKKTVILFIMGLHAYFPTTNTIVSLLLLSLWQSISTIFTNFFIPRMHTQAYIIKLLLI